MVDGRLIGIMVNGAFVNCEVSCTINFSQEMISKTAVTSGRWAEYIAGLRSWTVTANANLVLEAVAADIKSILLSGYFGNLPIFVMFATRPTATIELQFSGYALFNSGDITAGNTGKASANFTLQGTGALDKSIQDYPLLINAMPADFDPPLIVNEDV